MIPNLQLKNLLNLQNNPFKQPNLITEDLLKDNLTYQQKSSIESFLIAISVSLGVILITFSYLNYQERSNLVKINEETQPFVINLNTGVLDNKLYESNINSLNQIKSITQKTVKYSGFFQEITKLLELLKNQTLISLDYTRTENGNFTFTLLVNSPREDLFNETKKITDSKTLIKNLTLTNKVKIENSNDFQYTFTGDYNAR